MDVESAHVFGDTPYERAIAVLVGLAALLAACLTTLQQDADRREERALVMGTRLSVDIFEGTAASGLFSAFQLGSTRDVSALLLEAASRGTAAFEEPSITPAVLAVVNSYLEAQERLLRVAESMGSVPSDASGVHPHTVAVMATSPQDLQAVVEEQNRQVDLADRYGTKGNRSVLAISLLTVGAVLLALAAVTGRGRTGFIALGASVLLLGGSTAMGILAVVT